MVKQVFNGINDCMKTFDQKFVPYRIRFRNKLLDPIPLAIIVQPRRTLLQHWYATM